MLTSPALGRSLVKRRVATAVVGSLVAVPLAATAVPSSASALTPDASPLPAPDLTARTVHHHHHHGTHRHHKAKHRAQHTHEQAAGNLGAAHTHKPKHRADGAHKAHKPHTLTQAEDAKLREKILDIASSKRGTPYVYGAAGPSAFDCSGFTMWVFSHLGISLPHHAASQVGDTRIVRNPKPGDLVFFGGGSGVYHVGIYAGHHQIWHAPYPGRGVMLETLWTNDVFYGRVRGI